MEAEIYRTLMLVWLLDKRPGIISLRREFVASRSNAVLTKPNRTFVAKQQAVKGFFPPNNYQRVLIKKAQIAVKHLCVKVVSKSAPSASFIYSSNRRLVSFAS